MVRAAYLTSIEIPLQLDPNRVEMDLNLFMYTAILFTILVQCQRCNKKTKSCCDANIVVTQSGTKPNLVAKILATKIGNLWA